MSYPPHHKEVVNLLLRQEWYLQRLYANLSRDLASVLRKYKVNSKKNMWYGNAEVKKEINTLMKRYERIYFSYISEQIKKGWELSNKHNDTFVNNYTKGIKVPKKEKQKYYQRNNEALNAFVNRSQNGYKLSDRVWNLTNQTQEQIDHFIKAGLTDGRSASKLSKDVRQFLKEPDKRFRRIRDKETGKLKLSKPAKNYHPGQGVYRSSYKNALRLARNEINIAYRTSDFERRKQLPFILGVNVKLSPAHPQYDICDELQGEYPKNFKFTGWHPNCLCYTTSKLMDKKDFVKYLKGEKQPTGHTKRIPKRAEKFIKDNTKKIKNYKGKPYFIADNFKATKDGFELKKEIVKSNINIISADKKITEPTTYRQLTIDGLEDLRKKQNINELNEKIVKGNDNGYIATANSFVINEELRMYGKALTSEGKATVKALDELIKNNVLKNNIILHRNDGFGFLQAHFGLGMSDVMKDTKDIIKKIKATDKTQFYDNGFYSTSAIKAKNVFKNRIVQAEIRAKKGTNAFITDNKTESEIILGRKQKLKIIDIQETENNKIKFILETN